MTFAESALCWLPLSLPPVSLPPLSLSRALSPLASPALSITRPLLALLFLLSLSLSFLRESRARALSHARSLLSGGPVRKCKTVTGVLKNKHSTHTEDGEAAAQLHMNKGNVDTRVWKGRGAFERFYQQVCIVSAGSSFDLFKVVSVLSVPPPPLSCGWKVGIRHNCSCIQTAWSTDSSQWRALLLSCLLKTKCWQPQ